MHIRNRIRWLLSILLVISLFQLVPAWAQYDDVVGFRVLSESQNELVLEIQSYYSGSHGATAYLSVLPTVNGSAASGIGYSSGRCPNNNSISTGSNSTCMTLSSAGSGNQISTDGLQICMFGGASRANFHCETFGHRKQWGAYGGQPSPQPPVAPQPFGGGPIAVTATANPPVLSRGQQTSINVYVQDSQGRPLPHAMVTVSAGGGRFARTGTTAESGPTDSSGSFVGYWSCDPCARGYVGGVRVTKQGYSEASAQWRVEIR